VLDRNDNKGFIFYTGFKSGGFVIHNGLIDTYVISSGKLIQGNQTFYLRKFDSNKLKIVNDSKGVFIELMEGFIYDSFWYLFHNQNVYIIRKSIEEIGVEVLFSPTNFKNFIKCEGDRNKKTLFPYILMAVVVVIIVGILIGICLYCLCSKKNKISFVLKGKEVAKTDSIVEDSKSKSSIKSENKFSTNAYVMQSQESMVKDMVSTGFNVSDTKISQVFAPERQMNDASDISIVRPTELSIKKKT
jgi:hypothetical protein